MEVPVPPKLVPLIELDEDEAEVALEEKATSCQRDVETQSMYQSGYRIMRRESR